MKLSNEIMQGRRKQDSQYECHRRFEVLLNITKRVGTDTDRAAELFSA